MKSENPTPHQSKAWYGVNSGRRLRSFLFGGSKLGAQGADTERAKRVEGAARAPRLRVGGADEALPLPQPC